MPPPPSSPRRDARPPQVTIFFHVTQGNRLGRDVKLSPPRFGRRQTGTSQSLSVLSRLNGMSCVMETLCSKGSDTSFFLRLALLNLGRLPVGCDTWLQGGVHVVFPLFPSRVGFLVGTCFSFGIFLFWPVFSHRRSRFSLLDFPGCPHPLRFFFVLANKSLPFVLRHLGRGGSPFLIVS